MPAVSDDLATRLLQFISVCTTFDHLACLQWTCTEEVLQQPEMQAPVIINEMHVAIMVQSAELELLHRLVAPALHQQCKAAALIVIQLPHSAQLSSAACESALCIDPM